MRWPVATVVVLVACGPITSKDVVLDPDQVGAQDDTDPGYVAKPGTDTAVEPSPISIEITNAPFAAEIGDTSQQIVGTIGHDTYDVSDLTLTLSSDRDGVLTPPPVDTDGTFRTGVDTLSKGEHRLTFTVTDPDGKKAEVTVKIGVCDYPPMQTFDTSPTGTGWQIYGDAYWDPNGWMEITGNAGSRAGSIYKTDFEIDSGDFRIEFRIATGGGINSGADGYAVNIVNVVDVEALEEYIDRAADGGCLGYGVVAGCTDAPLRVDAFHIEFDTWYNNEPHIQDQTQGNHISISLDGAPANHILWAPFQLETNPLTWHDVAVQAQGTVISVEIDGQMLVQQSVPGFQFDGGFIGVSGSTGWATNFHRFDNLKIYDRCEIPLEDTDTP